MITVKAAQNDGRVALWQRDPRHPDGEVYIVGDGSEHKVGETAAVKDAIRKGLLVVVEASQPASKSTKSADKAD